MKRLAKKFWAGAKKIERYGWARRTFGSKVDGYCILGSFGVHSAHSSFDEDRILLDVLGEDVSSITWWNDYKCESNIVAISLLQAAAICVEEGI